MRCRVGYQCCVGGGVATLGNCGFCRKRGRRILSLPRKGVFHPRRKGGSHPRRIFILLKNRILILLKTGGSHPWRKGGSHLRKLFVFSRKGGGHQRGMGLVVSRRLVEYFGESDEGFGGMFIARFEGVLGPFVVLSFLIVSVSSRAALVTSAADVRVGICPC
jgi:hypothetical protein